MTNVNKNFRNYLTDNCILSTLVPEKISPSKIDKTVKILFRTNDNNFIETVWNVGYRFKSVKGKNI